MKSFYKLKRGRHGMVPLNLQTAMLMGLKGILENEQLLRQANGIKDILYYRAAQTAIKIVRKWDLKALGHEAKEKA